MAALKTTGSTSSMAESRKSRLRRLGLIRGIVVGAGLGTGTLTSALVGGLARVRTVSFRDRIRARIGLCSSGNGTLAAARGRIISQAKNQTVLIGNNGRIVDYIEISLCKTALIYGGISVWIDLWYVPKPNFEDMEGGQVGGSLVV